MVVANTQTKVHSSRCEVGVTMPVTGLSPFLFTLQVLSPFKGIRRRFHRRLGSLLAILLVLL